jgi:MoxR-like ATPase
MSIEPQAQLISKDKVERFAAKCGEVLDAMNGVILGKPDLIRMTLATLLARGHALLEGLPGLGKTVLVKSFAQTLGITYQRIQFTPDLLPSDITGSYVLEEGEGGREMRFYPGPVFTNLLLADEVNRASPKTQSALLEAMSERQVTQLGRTMPLEDPFCVLATQNPIELEGTYPLPEAQLDRFAVKLDVTGVDKDVLKTIITSRKDGRPVLPKKVLWIEELKTIQNTVREIFLPEAIAEHISSVVALSHADAAGAPDDVKTGVKFGSSPRGAIWLAQIAKALALIDGRPGVGFEDVRLAAPAVLGHRIILHHAARLDGKGGRGIAAQLVDVSEGSIVKT